MIKGHCSPPFYMQLSSPSSLLQTLQDAKGLIPRICEVRVCVCPVPLKYVIVCLLQHFGLQLVCLYTRVCTYISLFVAVYHAPHQHTPGAYHGCSINR